jgi:hypothetical protein
VRGISRVVCLLVVLVPRLVAAQPPVGQQAAREPDEDPPGRLSVHLAGGATIPSGNDGPGNVQSVSIGYSPTPKLTVLVSGGRAHKLPRVRQFPDGFSRTAGGTLQFVSGEVRFTLRSDRRVSPYALAGAGLGVWRRSEAIAEPLTNAAHVWFSAGGLVVPLGPHLRVSGDAGFLVLMERDVLHLFLPVRAGLAWRF